MPRSTPVSVLSGLLVLSACGGGSDVDAGATADAGPDGGAVTDGGGSDVDAAATPDGGATDAGSPDAGGLDASGDAGVEFDPTSAYQVCDGNTFYPSGCEAEACVEDGLERRVYDLWRARFMAIHGLSATEMDARISISDVSVADGPTYVWWRVDYVFVLDWARSRQSESVNLGDYPLASPPTDDEITRAVDLAIEAAEQFDLAAIEPISAVLAATASCAEGMTLDFCHLDFVNVTGELTVRGRKDLGGGTCQRADVDVGRASVTLCTTQPCAIM